MSVRTDRFCIDVKLSIFSGVLLHMVPASWSAVPLLSLCQASFSSAMPMLGGVPECGAQPLRTQLTVLCFPSILRCMHIYLSQVLLPGLWRWLSSAGATEGQMMPVGHSWSCYRVKREGHELVSVLSHKTLEDNHLLVRLQALAVSKSVS